MTALRIARGDEPERHRDPVADHRAAIDARWSRTDMLLAALVDEMRWQHYARLASAPGKGARPDPPEPLPRPGVPVPERVIRPEHTRGRLTPDQRRSLDKRMRPKEMTSHG